MQNDNRGQNSERRESYSKIWPFSFQSQLNPFYQPAPTQKTPYPQDTTGAYTPPNIPMENTTAYRNPLLSWWGPSKPQSNEQYQEQSQEQRKISSQAKDVQINKPQRDNNEETISSTGNKVTEKNFEEIKQIIQKSGSSVETDHRIRKNESVGTKRRRDEIKLSTTTNVGTTLRDASLRTDATGHERNASTSTSNVATTIMRKSPVQKANESSAIVNAKMLTKTKSGITAATPASKTNSPKDKAGVDVSRDDTVSKIKEVILNSKASKSDEARKISENGTVASARTKLRHNGTGRSGEDTASIIKQVIMSANSSKPSDTKIPVTHDVTTSSEKKPLIIDTKPSGQNNMGIAMKTKRADSDKIKSVNLSSNPVNKVKNTVGAAVSEPGKKKNSLLAKKSQIVEKNAKPSIEDRPQNVSTTTTRTRNVALQSNEIIPPLIDSKKSTTSIPETISNAKDSQRKQTSNAVSSHPAPRGYPIVQNDRNKGKLRDNYGERDHSENRKRKREHGSSGFRETTRAKSIDSNNFKPATGAQPFWMRLDSMTKPQKEPLPKPTLDNTTSTKGEEKNYRERQEPSPKSKREYIAVNNDKQPFWMKLDRMAKTQKGPSFQPERDSNNTNEKASRHNFRQTSASTGSTRPTSRQRGYSTSTVSAERPFEVPLDPMRPIGGYFQSEFGRGHSKCILFSIYPRGQLARDKRFKVGTQVTAVVVGGQRFAVSDDVQLRFYYNDAKHHRKHFRLILRNSYSCRTESIYASNENWHPNGKWIGRIKNGWAGGAEDSNQQQNEGEKVSRDTQKNKTHPTSSATPKTTSEGEVLRKAEESSSKDGNSKSNAHEIRSIEKVMRTDEHKSESRKTSSNSINSKNTEDRTLSPGDSNVIKKYDSVEDRAKQKPVTDPKQPDKKKYAKDIPLSDNEKSMLQSKEPNQKSDTTFVDDKAHPGSINILDSGKDKGALGRRESNQKSFDTSKSKEVENKTRTSEVRNQKLLNSPNAKKKTAGNHGDLIRETEVKKNGLAVERNPSKETRSAILDKPSVTNHRAEHTDTNPKQIRELIIPTKNDVLSFSGSGGHKKSEKETHPGNLRFREIVASKADGYFSPSSTKNKKSLIVESILKSISCLKPQGRFLKFDTSTGKCSPMSESDASIMVRLAIHRAQKTKTNTKTAIKKMIASTGEADKAVSGTEQKQTASKTTIVSSSVSTGNPETAVSGTERKKAAIKKMILETDSANTIVSCTEGKKVAPKKTILMTDDNNTEGSATERQKSAIKKIILSTGTDNQANSDADRKKKVIKNMILSTGNAKSVHSVADPKKVDSPKPPPPTELLTKTVKTDPNPTAKADAKKAASVGNRMLRQLASFNQPPAHSEDTLLETFQRPKRQRTSVKIFEPNITACPPVAAATKRRRSSLVVDEVDPVRSSSRVAAKKRKREAEHQQQQQQQQQQASKTKRSKSAAKRTATEPIAKLPVRKLSRKRARRVATNALMGFLLRNQSASE